MGRLASGTEVHSKSTIYFLFSLICLVLGAVCAVAAGSADPVDAASASEAIPGPYGLTAAAKAGCGDGWDDRFFLRGTNGPVNAFAEVNGDLYVAGNFTVAGGANAYLARWDGAALQPVPGPSNYVNAMLAVGDTLYIAGGFTSVGGVPANRIARWDGAAWSALGSGTSSGTINALAVWNGDLYAGGQIPTIGGVAVSNVARWNGAAWQALGTGVNGTVNAITADSAGIYVGGNFTTASGTTVNRIAKWDGATWSALGTGATSTNANVLAITIDGADLYAGGSFSQIGGVTVANIARWDGASWSALGPGINNGVRTMVLSGGALVVGGGVTTVGGVTASRITRWDGLAWQTLGAGVSSPGVPNINRLLSRPDGSGGQEIFVGGSFTSADGVGLLNVARWDGATWGPLGDGQAPNARILSLASGAAAGGGQRIFAVGDFTAAGTAAAYRVAAWDPVSGAWEALGAGLGATGRDVVTDGTTTYVCGSFTSPGNRIARWNGAAWSELGIGMNNIVEVMALVPNGAGGLDLYAGGGFTTAGGLAASRIARWNGAAWSALGAGVNNTVERIAFAPNGTGGYDLYVGGQFTTAGGAPANRIAKWDGAAWSPLGAGLDGTLDELLVFGDGAGGVTLYAGGSFTAAGGVQASNIAMWDGMDWSPLGGGVNGSVNAMAMKNGSLYVSGNLTEAEGMPVPGLALWDGAAWSSPGTGPSPGLDALLFVGEDMYVGGLLMQAGCATSLYFGRFTAAASAVAGPDLLPPRRAMLEQNHPNPFNPRTEIAFSLERRGFVELKVYDLRGRAVATLVAGDLDAGAHTTLFDGRGLASGVYFCRLRAGGQEQTRKMTLVR